MDSDAGRFRKLFIEAVRPYAEWPLFLSGGTDSLTILAALLALDAKPHCFHFVVDGWPSDDRLLAESVADTCSLSLDVVTAPNTLLQLYGDIVWLLENHLLGYPKYNPSRTTVLQCCHVTYYLCCAAREFGYKQALMGVGGVTDDTRNCAVAYHKGGDRGAEPYRRYTLYMGTIPLEQEVNPINAEIALAAKMGVRVAQPYTSHPFAEWLLALSWEQVNRPGLKGIARRAFPEFWERGDWFTGSRTNMHVGSGMREWHDSLIESPYNERGMRKTAAVYRDIIASLDDIEG